MKLEDYLRINGLSKKEFADLLGLSRTHFSNICNQKRKATADIARNIEIITKKKVSRCHILWPEEYN